MDVFNTPPRRASSARALSVLSALSASCLDKDAPVLAMPAIPTLSSLKSAPRSLPVSTQLAMSPCLEVIEVIRRSLSRKPDPFETFLRNLSVFLSPCEQAELKTWITELGIPVLPSSLVFRRVDEPAGALRVVHVPTQSARILVSPLPLLQHLPQLQSAEKVMH